MDIEILTKAHEIIKRDTQQVDVTSALFGLGSDSKS